jgi:single-stranded-DNA-specific exonuclease
MIEEQGYAGRKSTVLFNKEWHKGVIGIVASRIIDQYHRPTILLTESNGMAVGSARSVEGFNLYRAIKECDDILTQWGGHNAAAGLSLPLDRIDELREKFEETVSCQIDHQSLNPALEYDLEISLDQITINFCRSIKRFGPFGPENHDPVFASRNVKLSGIPRVVGNNHLQLSFTDSNKTVHRAIAFGFGDWAAKLSEETTFDICYTVEINTFRGVESISLNIKDIQAW